MPSVFLSLLLSILLPTELLARTDACMMLVAVDHTVVRLFDNNEKLIRTKVTEYVEKLNDIYESSILKYPPHDNIYFQVKELRILRNFLPGCENKAVVLNEFSSLAQPASAWHTCSPTEILVVLWGWLILEGCAGGMATLGGLRWILRMMA